MIPRTLAQIIPRSIKNGFITIIYGPRRVGKTVLLEQIKTHFKNEKILTLNGDTQEAQEALETNSEVKLSRLVENCSVIFIDEAQRIRNITLALKILIDKFPEKKIIATGSSSLELAKGATENLTGRYVVWQLFSFSISELSLGLEKYQISSLLEEQLIYGTYPYLQQLNLVGEKQQYLASIINDYLFKDILFLEKIENPQTLKKLAVLLAFQIGSEVSANELSKKLGIDVKTVIRYIDLLKKAFIIFEVRAFSSNLRREINRNKKYFFYDLGIRNALINQFLPLDSRTDIGALWENFLFVERKKKFLYQGNFITEHFFWRNYQGAEIDMVEISTEKEKKAFEFKWNKKENPQTPTEFYEKYKIKIETINSENFWEFLF